MVTDSDQEELELTHEKLRVQLARLGEPEGSEMRECLRHGPEQLGSKLSDIMRDRLDSLAKTVGEVSTNPSTTQCDLELRLIRRLHAAAAARSALAEFEFNARYAHNGMTLKDVIDLLEHA